MQKNDYILRRRKDMWHFFHVDKSGLCLRKKQDGRWGSSQVLLDNAFFDFSVICDGEDNIHMVCQDMDGNILYLAYHHEQWHKYTLMKSKSGGAYAKHFKLLLIGSQLQLFYTIRSSTKLLLVQQLMGSENDPVMVDVVHDSLRPFFAVHDDFMNTWIYYQNSDGVFGCRMHSWSKKLFGDFISSGENRCDSPFVCLDAYEHHHIVCLQKGKLLYMQMNSEGEFNNKHFVSTPENVPIYLPILLGDISKLWLIWRQNNGVKYSVRTVSTNEWSEPHQYIHPPEVDVQLIAFQREAVCFYCWGYMSNGDIHLFAADAETHVSRLDTTTAIQENTPPMIKRYGEDVENFAARHMQNASLAPSPVNHSNVEVTKLSIAFSALNDQVSKLKRQMEQLWLKSENLNHTAVSEVSDFDNNEIIE